MSARRPSPRHAKAWRIALFGVLVLHLGTAAFARALGNRPSADALGLAGRTLLVAASSADASLRSSLLAAAATAQPARSILQVSSETEPIARDQQTGESGLDPDFPEPLETLDEEDEEADDITLPDPAELTGQTAAAATTGRASGSSRASTGTQGARGFQPNATAATSASEAKGVLPEDVEESIERAIDAHGTSAAAAVATETGLEKPAVAGDGLAGGGRGATAASKDAAVAGGQEAAELGKLTSADVVKEEQVLEALEEKLEEEPAPRDGEEAVERIEEEAELQEEEAVLAEEAAELQAEERAEGAAGHSASAQQQQQQRQQQVQAGGIAAAGSQSAKAPAAGQGSLVTQGVILGGAIKDMVADNSTGIAGAVAVVLAILAGIGVAFAGIALYQRMRRSKDGKPGPRIIEIGGLTGSRKSPSYARVGNRNGDGEGSSGAPWKAWEERWEDDGRPQPPANGNGATARNGAAGKQRKAWSDWDEEW